LYNPLFVLLGHNLVDNNGEIVKDSPNEIIAPYESPIHSRTMDTEYWIRFLHERTGECIAEIWESAIVREYDSYLKKIAEGFDIWDDSVPLAVEMRETVLNCFAAHS
jgi:hypothetical protein